MRGVGAATTAYAAVCLALLLSSSRSASLLWAPVLCVAALGLAGGTGLLLQRRRAVLPAAAFVGSMVALGLFLLGRRIAYVIQYGSMDGGPGQGSPVAFLIGAVFELSTTTLPALGLAVWLRRSHKLTPGTRAA